MCVMVAAWMVEEVGRVGRGTGGGAGKGAGAEAGEERSVDVGGPCELKEAGDAEGGGGDGGVVTWGATAADGVGAAAAAGALRAVHPLCAFGFTSDEVAGARVEEAEGRECSDEKAPAHVELAVKANDESAFDVPAPGGDRLAGAVLGGGTADCALPPAALRLTGRFVAALCVEGVVPPRVL